MKSSPVTLAETGELAFISAIRAMLPEPGGMIVRATGEDCLVTAAPDGGMLHTIDTFVDGVHFDPAFFGWDAIGRRIMAASVSDIAAMAGIPAFSLVSMSMPGSALLDDMAALFRGMQEAAEGYGCPVAGGETTSTPGPVTVTITVAGTAEPSGAVTRAGARSGNRVFITGTIGDAMAGLRVFARGIAGYDSLRRAFSSPKAQVTAAQALAAAYDLTAMIDISDGLATDLRHICTESGAGAEIVAERLPLSDEFRAFAAAEGLDAVEFAVRSGEEFQLLFTSGNERIPDTFEAAGLRVTCIGEITGAGQGIRLVDAGGGRQPLTSQGYEHFRQ